MYYIYILHSKEADRYYVGHTNQPTVRLEQHRTNSGDRFTGKFRDWIMVGLFEVGERKGDADRIEKWIKRQKSRRLIESMLNPGITLYGPLAQLVRVPLS